MKTFFHTMSFVFLIAAVTFMAERALDLAFFWILAALVVAVNALDARRS